jgi:hypothetical protein
VRALVNGHLNAVVPGWSLSEAFIASRLGIWLVGHGVAWLRPARCERVVLTTAAHEEAAGSGRLYRRLGWDVLARLERAWGYEGGDQGSTGGR